MSEFYHYISADDLATALARGDQRTLTAWITEQADDWVGTCDALSILAKQRDALSGVRRFMALLQQHQAVFESAQVPVIAPTFGALLQDHLMRVARIWYRQDALTEARLDFLIEQDSQPEAAARWAMAYWLHSLLSQHLPLEPAQERLDAAVPKGPARQIAQGRLLVRLAQKFGQHPSHDQAVPWLNMTQWLTKRPALLMAWHGLVEGASATHRAQAWAWMGAAPDTVERGTWSGPLIQEDTTLAVPEALLPTALIVPGALWVPTDDDQARVWPGLDRISAAWPAPIQRTVREAWAHADLPQLQARVRLADLHDRPANNRVSRPRPRA